jgi:hypothetical protein
MVEGLGSKKAEEIAEKTSHIQLSLGTDFQTEFANAMIFPYRK